jgi:hypothetical protein
MLAGGLILVLALGPFGPPRAEDAGAADEMLAAATPLVIDPTPTTALAAPTTTGTLIIDVTAVPPAPEAVASEAVTPAASPAPAMEIAHAVSPPAGNPAPAPALSLVVETADVAFGAVSASGEVDPAVSGVVASADAGGASYVRLGAIRLVVTSDGPWSGTCRVDVDGAGRLEWRFAGTDAWTPFAAGPAVAPYDNSCFPDRPSGTTTFVYDLRLQVSASDPVGPFSTRIDVAVAP